MTSMAGLYCVTAQKPTVVNFSVVGSFTGPADQNLILGRCNRIEVHSIGPDGLKGVMETAVYGRISAMLLFRPPGSTKDLLLVLTHRYKLVILEYDEVAGEIRTRASGDVSSRIARPTDAGMMAFVDPECRVIGLHLYDGLIKVIPISETGEFLEAFDLRLEELMIKDMRFLYGRPRPTVAYLYEDSRELRHAKTLEILVKEKEFSEGPWQQQHLDNGASLLLPLPQPSGGAVIVGENVLSYVNAGQLPLAIPMPQSAVIRAHGMVDADGSRFFLSDHTGQLYVLAISCEAGKVKGMRLEPIGYASPAECLSYLDNGVVFIGSSFTDSQLVRVKAEPVSDKPLSYVEVLDNWTHVGPVQDFCVVDVERQGQGQVVTCSGIHRHGTLRLIRSGIGINEQAALPLDGIKGVWSLRTSDQDEFDQMLVVSFVGETRFLQFNDEAELDEVEAGGFEGGRQTLLCCGMDGGMWMQATPSSVRLVRASDRSLLSEWKPHTGAELILATAAPKQVVVTSRGGHVVYLEVDGGNLVERAHRQLGGEVSCLDIALLTPAEDASRVATTLAAGMWTGEVVLLALPTLHDRASAPLGAEGGVIPRSCALVTFEEGHSVLLAALGDGQLCSFQLDPATCALTDAKRVPIGTKPVTLKRFYLGANVNVFAACDRPAVVYSSKKKLLFSAVNTDEVLYMSDFHCPGYPNCLALAKNDALVIGNIDEIQKLHTRTLHLQEQPRRIAYHEPSQCFAVATIEYKPPPPDRNTETQACWVRLIQASTLEVLDSFPLEATEEPSAITCLVLDDATSGGAGASGSARPPPSPPLIVVGTAYVLPEQDEPKKGRILMFEVKEGKLNLVGVRETKGAVWALEGFHGKLLSSVNHRVYLHRASHRVDEGSWELHPECSYQGHTLSLYLACRGDSVLVGDLMKSITLLQYRADEAAFDDRARDFNPQWMTAVQFIDEDTYIGAENCFNLFVAKKNSDAANDEDRSRLEIVGEYGLGLFVNRIRPGSIVMKLPDVEAQFAPSLIYGTVEGAVGLLVPLSKAQFELLDKLQRAMQKETPGVGNLLHEDYRQFANDMASARDAKGFIDGDLVETFLDFRRDRQEELVCRMGPGVTSADVVKLVEDLARLH